MSTPVRVTAQIIGASVFSTKDATLEWTSDGRVRIAQVEPGQQPVVLLDTVPAELKQVTRVTVKQPSLSFHTHDGTDIRLSLLGSVLAPEPHESADAYARRTAMTAAPPQQWWVDMLKASGATVVDWGRKGIAIGLGVVAGILVLSAILATFL